MEALLKDKLNRLEQWFLARQGSIVAFSGGIDSSLALYMARHFQGRDNVVGVISGSESLKSRDLELARDFCRRYDIRLEEIYTGEIADERYNSNPVNRCYFCKMHLFDSLQRIKEQYPAFDVLSGANSDDGGDYRPGMQAATEHRVLSPLAECGITKPDVRQLAQYFGLPNWNKPASPCLSSRIPYNQPVTQEKLRQIEAAESIVNELGFSDVRVRHYGNMAKVEVPPAEFPRLQAVGNEVVEKIKAVGFEEVLLDPEGLVSGKLNRVLNKSSK
ncbi:MAG: ATP-dependent sacrificial sulfur transferase LarE [Bacteroidales bacterium]|jgi:uncharacterized protein|nr:ATP-dependent sacrificial sulfur transferase LarE [Bacteroidales bacterium]